MNPIYVGVAGWTVPVWCIFDNTAEAAATVNGLDVLAQTRRG
jgi:hypothetical protein